MNDPVNHPAHYTNPKWPHEVIELTEHLDFCYGNAVKYILRAPFKGNEVQDLEKALWYVNRADPDRALDNDDMFCTEILTLADTYGEPLVNTVLTDPAEAAKELKVRILEAKVRKLEAEKEETQQRRCIYDDMRAAKQDEVLRYIFDGAQQAREFGWRDIFGNYVAY